MEKTLERISIIENSPSIKSMLIKFIAQKKVVYPDRKTSPAQTLDEYYDFYFLNDQPLAEPKGQGYYK
jgi:hypothetical protein